MSDTILDHESDADMQVDITTYDNHNEHDERSSEESEDFDFSFGQNLTPSQPESIIDVFKPLQSDTEEPILRYEQHTIQMPKQARTITMYDLLIGKPVDPKKLESFLKQSEYSNASFAPVKFLLPPSGYILKEPVKRTREVNFAARNPGIRESLRLPCLHCGRLSPDRRFGYDHVKLDRTEHREEVVLASYMRIKERIQRDIYEALYYDYVKIGKAQPQIRFDNNPFARKYIEPSAMSLNKHTNILTSCRISNMDESRKSTNREQLYNVKQYTKYEHYRAIIGGDNMDALLPRSSLLNAIHGRCADFASGFGITYRDDNADSDGYHFMDASALLAFGILLEEYTKYLYRDSAEICIDLAADSED